MHELKFASLYLSNAGIVSYAPQHEKFGLQSFRPGQIQTDLYSQRSRLEA